MEDTPDEPLWQELKAQRHYPQTSDKQFRGATLNKLIELVTSPTFMSTLSLLVYSNTQ